VSVVGWNPLQTAYAVLDVETAGVDAGQPLWEGHVVELAVVHVDLWNPPSLVFNSRLRPGTAIRTTAIHGISERDVEGAPTFADVAEHLESLFGGRVLVAHHAAFDRRALEAEFVRTSRPLPEVPWLCTMLLAQQLEISPSAALGAVSTAVYGRAGAGHAAPVDTWTTARVLRQLLWEAANRGLSTFGLLGRAVANPDRSPLPVRAPAPLSPGVNLHPRMEEAQLRDGTERVQSYAMAVTEHLLAPPEQWDADRPRVVELQRLLGLSEVRAAHAQVLGTSLWVPALKASVDDVDARQIELTLEELRRLGWAPGAAAGPTSPPPGPVAPRAPFDVGRVIKLARQRSFVEDLREKGGAMWVHGLPKGLRVQGWSWTDNPHTLCGRPGYFSKRKGTVVDCATPLFLAAGLEEDELTALFPA
jgi:DNA polymerase III epsilon subunit-like protein